ncbi:hypothetical protein CBFG_05331 [Clostridiales bacterium 1_7_47FAA]|nr:hypothetical protein CBFG_05331 [Clostridiales bacterium 1_7_47FAA]
MGFCFDAGIHPVFYVTWIHKALTGNPDKIPGFPSIPFPMDYLVVEI